MNLFRIHNNLVLAALALLVTFGLKAQPEIEWESSFGGSGLDFSYSGIQTEDGGYIVAGETYSTDGDITDHNGISDAWVVKLDNSGLMEWQTCLGGSSHDGARSIIQGNDGGYVLAGRALSNDGDVVGNNGNSDFWIVNLDPSGSIIWQTALGGSSTEEAKSIQQTTDGGYIVLGTSRSDDGDVSNNQGFQDYWVVKLTELGTIEWQYTYGGSGFDYAESVRQTIDGGYILAGTSDSVDGDISSNIGGHDFWVIKLDDVGIIEWEKSFGGSSSDFAYSIRQTSDSGYILAGMSWSSNGDLTNNNGEQDYWVLKLTESGLLQWQTSLGGSLDDWARSVVQTGDDGYVVTGMSISDDGDISNPNGDHDSWIVKLDENGVLEWEESIGGSGQESFFSIETTSEGGLVAFGQSTSTDGDVSSNNGFRDFWITKFGAETTGVLDDSEFLNVSLKPNPVSSELVIQLHHDTSRLNYSIINEAGVEIRRGSLSNGEPTINVQGISSGFYVLRISTKRSVKYLRFVKQ